DVDVVFAPAQPAVRPLAEAVGARLERPTAYWEYLPSGRYGSRLVEGSVPGGSRALALNAVSLQGRCVGLRLPQFVQGLGGLAGRRFLQHDSGRRADLSSLFLPPVPRIRRASDPVARVRGGALMRLVRFSA